MDGIIGSREVARGVVKAMGLPFTDDALKSLQRWCYFELLKALKIEGPHELPKGTLMHVTNAAFSEAVSPKLKAQFWAISGAFGVASDFTELDGSSLMAFMALIVPLYGVKVEHTRDGFTFSTDGLYHTLKACKALAIARGDIAAAAGH